MKIGILTFQYAINYGAVMQMHSLYSTLECLGHDVSIINYIPNNYKRNGLHDILNNIGIKNHNLITSIKRGIDFLFNNTSLCCEFDRFVLKNHNVTKQVGSENIKNLLSEFDEIIVGSDQVWNPYNQKDGIYFLNMDIKNEPIKISYAADSADDSVKSENIKTLNSALNDFYKISVRNKHTQDFVEKVTGISPQIVADPVILSDFSEFCSNDSSKKEKYALVYILGKEIPGGHEEVIEEIKQKYGKIKIYHVVMLKQGNFAIINNADKLFYHCSPEEWVNLIYNAEFVYTDSFHCILFAMKFHKSFLAYYAESIRAPRLKALQQQYELGSRIVSSVSDMKYNKSLEFELDFNKIDSIFDRQRNEGIQFLKDCTKSNL